MRKRRGMTQAQLAEEMNVSQAYVSQIENGKTKLVSLLTDYALEVGARLEYKIEPAENKPEGLRQYSRKEFVIPGTAVIESDTWSMGPAWGTVRWETKAPGSIVGILSSGDGDNSGVSMAVVTGVGDADGEKLDDGDFSIDSCHPAQETAGQ
ncbi:helix-turn-helix transcriptional regulator [Bifidobacterium eulemuris]|nr:helix-turn-helix transcriptional regulator [Bifidobacterium eulemuris]